MTGLKRIKSGFVQAGGIWSKGWLTRTTQASAQEKIRVKHDACAWLVPVHVLVLMLMFALYV